MTKHLIRLLVIEDDVVDQRAIKNSLNKSFLNFKVDFAADLKEAEVLLGATDSWDVILTDYYLPEHNGIEILSFLVEKHKVKVPVIVMTGSQNERIASEALQHGAFDFLTKNLITPEGIGLAIRTALRVYQEQQATEVLLTKLQKREKQLRETQKLAGLGSWDVNLSSLNFNWTNEADVIFEGQLGKEKPNWDSFLYWLVKEDNFAFQKAINEGFKSLLDFEQELRFKLPNNKVKTVVFRCKPIVNGGEQKLNGAVMDFTKQKLIEAQLTESKNNAENLARLKQDFLANMSHEIRTPMNAILGFAELVLKDEISASVASKVDKIKRSGENLLVIINDILDFSKIESGNLKFESIAFSPQSLVELVISQIEDLATKKKVRLIQDVEPSVPNVILGDPTRLQQILVNIVNNGVKFTHKGFVELRVATLAENENEIELQFEIEDTGIGISKSNQDKIFESFSQAMSDTTRLFGGTGLGLTITKNLIELQGGQIWIESEEEIGTTFYFKLTFQKAKPNDADQINQNDTGELSYDLTGKRVLLVEDNQMNRELAGYFLQDWGVEYDVAENGLKGVEKAQVGGYDLVLMDLSMPVMDGFQATKKIRGFSGEKGLVPIMAMTANAFKTDVDKCLAFGMNDHIAKPFNVDELRAKIGVLTKAIEVQTAVLEEPISVEAVDETGFLLNLDYLNKMSGGNADFVKQMVTLFIDETPQTLEVLQTSCLNKNWEGVKAKCHKLRSPLNMLGMTTEANLAEEIEASILDKKDDVVDNVYRLINQVRLGVDQAKSLNP